MTPTIVQTVKSLTQITATPTSVNTFTTKASSSIGANTTVASKPSMYPGIEKNSEVFREPGCRGRGSKAIYASHCKLSEVKR